MNLTLDTWTGSATAPSESTFGSGLRRRLGRRGVNSFASHPLGRIQLAPDRVVDVFAAFLQRQ